MKRFIDLTGQVTLGTERYFAWLDTGTDTFERHGDAQFWSSWAEFEQDYEGTDIERYRSLAAPWAFGCASESELPQVDTVEAVKLATLWVALQKIKQQIDNEAVPLGHHLGLEDPNLMFALEDLSAKINAHFSKFKLVAEPRKFKS
jgi:hypothetical protein